MAVDYSIQVNSLIVGNDVRWTNFRNYPLNTNYVRPLGSPTVVTYSFDQTLPSHMPQAASATSRPLTDTERAAVRTAATIWDNASGVIMMEVGSGRGQIQIGAYDFRATGSDGLSGYASYPGYDAGGDVYFNTRSEINIGLALHELGHALGLKHPFEPLRTGVTLPAGEDRTSNTVMSYTGGFQSQIGPYDTAAIRYLYGPDVPADRAFPAGYTAQSYLAANPDLLRAFGADPGAANYHYLVAGIWEGRSTRFDALEYIASNTDLVRAFGADEAAGTDHYVHSGFREGRSTAGFNPDAYLASHGDLEAAFGRDKAAATRHFVTTGLAEGRSVTFDTYGYLASNLDLLFAFGRDVKAGARHYLDHGRAEGRKTTGFDVQSYLAANADLRAAFGTDTAAATKHYVEYGAREGRPTFVFPTISRPPVTLAAANQLQGGGSQTGIPGFANSADARLEDALPRFSTPETGSSSMVDQREMAAPASGANLGFAGRDSASLAIGLYSPGATWP